MIVPSNLTIDRQVSYNRSNAVRLHTVSNPKSGTGYQPRNQLKQLEDEVRAAAKVIAEVQIDSPSSDVVLTANGRVNKAALKDALINIDYNCMNEVLKIMLRDGAYIHKAVCQEQIVGVVVIIQLPKEFAMRPGLPGKPSSEERALPPISDLKAVEAYARSKDVDNEFSYQLRGYLNSCLRHYGIGKLWGEDPIFVIVA